MKNNLLDLIMLIFFRKGICTHNKHKVKPNTKHLQSKKEQLQNIYRIRNPPENIPIDDKRKKENRADFPFVLK